MKIRRMAIGFSVMFLFVIAVGPLVAAEADSWTGASQTNYYGPAVDFEKLAMMTFNGVVVVSTTNPDGSPNAAVIIPSLLGEDYIIMRMAPNQTAENLVNDGRAVITVFVPSEEEPEPQPRSEVRKHGARLVCKALFAGEEYDAARELWNETVENEAYKLPAGEPILRILAIHPIG